METEVDARKIRIDLENVGGTQRALPLKPQSLIRSVSLIANMPAPSASDLLYEDIFYHKIVSRLFHSLSTCVKDFESVNFFSFTSLPTEIFKLLDNKK